MYDSYLVYLFPPANFSRSTLVTARSWWIQSSLDPKIRRCSRIMLSMGRIGSRYSAKSFSTPRKPIHWVASSGFLTGNSFQRNSEDTGADIACCGESQPPVKSLARWRNHIAHFFVAMTIWAKRSPGEEQ